MVKHGLDVRVEMSVRWEALSIVVREYRKHIVTFILNDNVWGNSRVDIRVEFWKSSKPMRGFYVEVTG
jgi:hypothetical protein